MDLALFKFTQQIDVMGQSVWDYVHQCDCTELREALDTRHLEPNHAANDGEVVPDLHRNILIRMKCTLTNRGKSVNIKSASYKVQCSVSFINIYCQHNCFTASRRVASYGACGA